MWTQMLYTQEEVARLHALYLDGLYSAGEGLRKRVSNTSDLNLDLSLESLVPLNEWFVKKLVDPELPDVHGVPTWWDLSVPTADTADPREYPLTRAQLSLVDEVQAYLGEVVFASYPGARWVTYKGKKNMINNGQSMIQLGKPLPYSPFYAAYFEALDVVLHDKEVPKDRLLQSVNVALDAE